MTRLYVPSTAGARAQRDEALKTAMQAAEAGGNVATLLNVCRERGMSELQAHQALRDVLKELQRRGAMRKPTKAEKLARKAARRAARVQP